MTQEKTLEILKTGVNVFLTGQAGSGKTYTIAKFIEFLEEEKKECKNRFMYDDGNKLYQLRLLDGDEIEKLER